MSETEFFRVIHERDPVTVGEFTPSQFRRFLDAFEQCKHSEAQQKRIEASRRGEAEWIRECKMRADLQPATLQVIRARRAKWLALAEQYPNGVQAYEDGTTDVDNAYWDYMQSLEVPSLSVECSGVTTKVLLHLLTLLNSSHSPRDGVEDREKALLTRVVPIRQEDEAMLVNRAGVVPREVNILDVGCGAGLTANQFFNVLPFYAALNQRFSFKFHGLDHSTRALDFSRLYKFIMEYEAVYNGSLADKKFMRDLGWKNSDGFDIVVSSNVLWRMPLSGEPGVQSFRNTLDMIKPGGLLVVGNPLHESPFCLRQAYNAVLQPYLDEHNMECIFDEVLQGKGFDEIAVAVTVYYKRK